MGFVQEAAGLYRLRVPFENLTTSVFLLLTQEGPVLYDCATTAGDVENVVLPALSQLQISPEQLRAIVLSHAHADHSGGLTALLQHAPQIQVVACAAKAYETTVYIPADGEVLFGCMQALYLPGHTADCLGLYDLRTDTLLTADALQLQGIGRYGCSAAEPDAYVQTIEKIRRLAPGSILTSHAYVPCGEKAEGAEEVACYLNTCRGALQEVEDFVRQYQGEADIRAIVADFCAQHPQWPSLSKATVKSLLQQMQTMY